MAQSIVVVNEAQVQAALAAIVPRVAAADERVENAGAGTVALLAERIAPRLTGKLAASVDDESGVVTVTDPKGGYIEFGTRHRAATPFLRPARSASEPLIHRQAEAIYTVATR